MALNNDKINEKNYLFWIFELGVQKLESPKSNPFSALKWKHFSIKINFLQCFGLELLWVSEYNGCKYGIFHHDSDIFKFNEQTNFLSEF